MTMENRQNTSHRRGSTISSPGQSKRTTLAGTTVTRTQRPTREVGAGSEVGLGRRHHSRKQRGGSRHPLLRHLEGRGAEAIRAIVLRRKLQQRPLRLRFKRAAVPSEALPRHRQLLMFCALSIHSCTLSACTCNLCLSMYCLRHGLTPSDCFGVPRKRTISATCSPR